MLHSQANAQQADITFFVIGKHGNFTQDAMGARHPVDYSFFSEIFLAADGEADSATLRFPTGERVEFRDMRQAEGGQRDNILLISGEDRFMSFAALQGRYPDGEYRVSVDTPSGAIADGVLIFEDRLLPDPPQVILQQGTTAGCRLLAPGRDALVSRERFEQGRADANGILDDLIFVILANSAGVRVAHSGRPFEGRPYLTYADTGFTIDGSALEPDQVYTLSVEHALLDDTTRFDGVPAFTTRAATTKLELRTASGDADTCAPMAPSITSQTTMFYYKDIEPAARFYGEVLGLENTLDWSWVRFYRTGPASAVGLVTEGDGGWHKVQANNAVMLSLVTEEVDAWYARLRQRDDVVFLKDIADGGPIRSFLLEDPGGYTVEFFQWREMPE